MEQFQYRAKSRIIAIVDLVLTSMSLWLPLMLLLAAVGFTYVSKNPELQSKAKEVMANDPDLSNGLTLSDDDVSASMGTMAAVTWILFIVCAIVVIVQLVAAVKLVNATQLGKDAVGAAKLSRFWRNCTIVFTVLLVLGGLKPSSPFQALFNWGCVFLRCIGIYVVHQFITELDVAVATGVLPSHHGQVPMTDGMAYSYIPPQNGEGNSPPNYNDVVKQ